MVPTEAKEPRMSKFPCPDCVKYAAADVATYCDDCEVDCETECCQRCGDRFEMDDMHTSEFGPTCNGCLGAMEQAYQDTFLRYRSA